MSECFMNQRGGSVDTDGLTATKNDVLAGKEFLGSESDEPQTGTMVNRGAVSQVLNAGGSIAIPEGYHNGSGIITSNTLASQTGATAQAGHISAGQTAWVNGSQVTGVLNTQVGTRVVPTTFDRAIVAAPKHVTGDIVVAGDPNLISSNIRSGVSIFGVVGQLGTPTVNYTGQFTLHDDGNNNWRVKFLTSGALTLTSNVTVDVFLVGGGSSGNLTLGGGGGYTTTARGITLLAGTPYSIIVGDGGAGGRGQYGGTSSAFNFSAAGGQGVNGGSGSGGTGGGETFSYFYGGSGGFNGSDGNYGGNKSFAPGIGQRSTTREFGEETGELYAGGGGTQGTKGGSPGSGGAGGEANIGGDGGSKAHPNGFQGGNGIGGYGGDYALNVGSNEYNYYGGGGGGGYGGGGGGGKSYGGNGFQGIVVIRNRR